MERQNDLFKHAQDLANVGGWGYDVRADEHIWTDQVYDIYDLPKSFDPTVQEGIAHYHPDDRPTIREVFTSAVEEGEPYDVELRLVSSEGEQRWVRTRGEPQVENGEIVRVRGSIQDITERKERQRRLEAIFNHTYQFTGLMEPDGTLIEVNDTALAFGGLTEESVLGTPIWDTFWFQVGAETKQRLQESVQRAAEGEFVRYEVEVQGAENTRIIDFSIRPVTNEEGDVVLLVPEGRDITERKKKERDLAHRKALLEAQSEATIDGLLAVDEDRNVAFYNERFLDIWEVPESIAKQDHIGKPLDYALLDHVNDLLEDPEGFREKVEHLYQHPTEESRDLIQLADGRWLDRYSAPILGDDGTHFGRLWVFRDVTGRREREEQLRAAKEEAERMNRLKSAFLANMSHEIRTPLTSIIGFAEMIDEEVAALEPRDTELDLSILSRYSSLIRKGGQRLMETLEDVLDLSKLEAGEMNLTEEVVNLGEEARDLVEQFEPQARDAELALRAESPEEVVRAHVDPDGLRIALRNLVNNATKYTEGGGQVWVRVRQEEDASVVEVEDTGIGMDPERVAELFEAFVQESEGIGREYEGSGLGLTVTKEVVNQMGGSIDVATEKGQGSCFTIRLPRADG